MQMPEVVEIKITSEELHRSLSGKYIIRISLSPRAKHHQLDTIKSGTLIERVYSKGKKIIFELRHKDKLFWMCSSLLMEGHWGWRNDLPHIQFGIVYGRKFNDKIYVVENTIYFDDTRYFGSNDVYYSYAQIKSVLDGIGPDLLQDVIDPDYYLEVARSRSANNKQVCSFLLEQKFFSGVGNYLKSEILYRCRIRPDREMNSLSDEEIYSLLETSIEVIKESYRAGGLTIATFHSPTGKEGKFVCRVYGKQRDPLGNIVRKDTFKDKRTTHWVEKLQT